MRKVNLRFFAGDSIICTYNPFKKYLKYQKLGTNEVCFLNVNQETDKLYACVRISHSGDKVKVLNVWKHNIYLYDKNEIKLLKYK